MVASGLNAETLVGHTDHVVAIADYAFAIKQQLAEINMHSFNNFKLRIGQYFKN